MPNLPGRSGAGSGDFRLAHYGRPPAAAGPAVTVCATAERRSFRPAGTRIGQGGRVQPPSFDEDLMADRSFWVLDNGLSPLPTRIQVGESVPSRSLGELEVRLEEPIAFATVRIDWGSPSAIVPRSWHRASPAMVST
jgi:hypothetical protein